MKSLESLSRIASIFLFSFAVITADGQTPDPSTMLRDASAKSLANVTTKPWHLKIDMTVFDDQGRNPVNGTVEVWQSGKDQRSIYTFGSAVKTLLVNDGITYHGSGNGSVPFGASYMLDHLLYPGPTEGEIAHSKPELRKQSFGKLQMECIMLDQPILNNAFPPLGTFPTYCIDPKDGALRVSYNFGGQTFVADALGRFVDHDVIMQSQLSEGKITIANAKVMSLVSYTPTTDEFKPGPEMTRGNGTARIASGLMAGLIVKKVPPNYPPAAKQKGIGGTVVMHALIGKDGHVHQLQVVSSGDPDLSLAALEAVRQWVYKPYILNGEPTEVDTTVTVNFNLNR